ncbi:hypothetical protein FQK02_03755 [Xanthomonas vasicola]|nr:hypothetical protein FQK02_03755 [Xanthomonas vasicola]
MPAATRLESGIGNRESGIGNRKGGLSASWKDGNHEECVANRSSHSRFPTPDSPPHYSEAA